MSGAHVLLASIAHELNAHGRTRLVFGGATLMLDDVPAAFVGPSGGVVLSPVYSGNEMVHRARNAMRGETAEVLAALVIERRATAGREAA